MVYNSRPRWLSSFMIFPGRCLCCGVSCNTSAGINRDLCPDCKANLPWQQYTCPRCALPLSAPSHSPCGECQQRLPHFQQAIAPFRYTTPVNRLINDFKHYDRQAGGRVLGELFCEWLLPRLADHSVKTPDYLLPVPLHWSRLWKRGFNQAHWLAQDIGKQSGIDVMHDALQRHRSGLAQQALTRRQRKANLQATFKLNPKRVEQLHNRHVAVIDDVMTTGTTANQIARLLMENSVGRVSIWVIARTPKRDA